MFDFVSIVDFDEKNDFAYPMLIEQWYVMYTRQVYCQKWTNKAWSRF